MELWICNSCHAQMAQKQKPNHCSLCGQASGGFEQGYKEDKPQKKDQKNDPYKKAVEKLKEYAEGCEPEKPESCCDSK